MGVIRLPRLARPQPPAGLLDLSGPPFQPAPDLVSWAQAVFIEPDGILTNPDHAHLRFATIGMLWTRLPNARKGQTVVGEAEMPMFRCGAWQKGRQEQQLAAWFGSLPDFVITLDAEYAAGADDATFCALVEHELYHCGQERGPFGEPKFRRNGMPAFAIRGHDVEEFVGVVARYGVGAAAGKTAELVKAANAGPTVSRALVVGACGTCGRRVA